MPCRATNDAWLLRAVLRAVLCCAGLKSLRKKVGGDVVDEAWTKRRLAAAVTGPDATGRFFFPGAGLYWMVVGHATYGEENRQGPVDREGMATLMEMEIFWNEEPQLMIYYAEESDKGWQPWTTVRPQLGL